VALPRVFSGVEKCFFFSPLNLLPYLLHRKTQAFNDALPCFSFFSNSADDLSLCPYQAVLFGPRPSSLFPYFIVLISIFLLLRSFFLQDLIVDLSSPPYEKRRLRCSHSQRSPGSLQACLMETPVYPNFWGDFSTARSPHPPPHGASPDPSSVLPLFQSLPCET